MPLPKRLLDGYTHFRNGRYAADAERYRELGQGQQPAKIMIIACCDSRTAPETVFDAAPGEIFVARNVANLVPPYTPDDSHHATSAALEFAVLSLGVEHIAIMGHGRCGGIRDAEHERLIERATIEHSLANLRTFPWVRVRESRGELALHGVWFDVSLGELHALNQANGQWVPVSVVAA